MISQYLEDTITWLSDEMKGSDALFGPSSMMSLIHKVQLELSGADLSFTAPLSINAQTLKKGLCWCPICLSFTASRTCFTP